MNLLNIFNLVAGYGDFQALFGVSLSVEEGKIVAPLRDALEADL